MSNKVSSIFDRLYLFALALLMAFFLYQNYTPGFALKNIKGIFEEAVRSFR